MAKAFIDVILEPPFGFKFHGRTLLEHERDHCVKGEFGTHRPASSHVKANFSVLSVQPDGELRDWTVSPSPGLLTMPSCLPSLDESVRSIFADGFLGTSDFL